MRSLCRLTSFALVASAAIAMASCARTGEQPGPAPRIVIATPAEAQAPAEFRGAEAAARDRPAGSPGGELRHAILPSRAARGGRAKPGADETAVASFIAGLAADPSVKAIVVAPALARSAEGFRRAKDARAGGAAAAAPRGLFCVAGDSREDALDIEASADLVVDLDRVNRAYLIPWAASKMGAAALVAVYSGEEAADPPLRPGAARERAIMSAACAQLRLRYAAMVAPAGLDAAAYVRAMTGAWLREYGRDTALYCSDPGLAPTLIAGAVAGGAIVVDAAGSATPAAYAAALGLDLGEAKGDPARERALLEGAVAALGGRGRFGLWLADYAEASVEGLAEFAYRAVGRGAPGSGRSDDLKDLVAALGDRNPAAWIAAYEIDPETGVKSANHVLVRQDFYVLGSGFLQSALRETPAKYLAIRADVP